jgi:MCP family monocarboxylic acid transporter-like MFS transporter 3
MGLGAGIMFIPAISVVSSYFERKRALALSITACGAAIGSIIFPATVQYLIPQVGFPWAVRCAAFVALFLVIILNVFFKPRTDIITKPGPILEWTAFKEPTYVCIATASFFLFLGLYVVTGYVSGPLLIPCCSQHIDSCCSDKHLCCDVSRLQ